MLAKRYTTHYAIRLQRVPQNNSWLIYHLIDHNKFEVSSNVACVLSAFANGEEFLKAYDILKKYIEITNEELDDIVGVLYKSNILIDSLPDDHLFALDLHKKWSQYYWVFAADYFLASFDYPFHIGDVKEYNEKDRSVMAQYIKEEPDLNRSKDYDASKELVITPSPVEALEYLNVSFENCLSNKNKKGIDAEAIKLIASITFGKLRSKGKDIPRKAAMVRKTTPSGGSRHPSEGYFIIRENMEDISQGIYHYSINKNGLEKLSADIPENLRSIFPGVFRGGFDPKVIIVITSLFERNMYRYREPRTFRTIFIDVGHLASNIKLISNTLGINYFSHSYIDETEAEKLLSLDKLSEGVIYSIGLS